MSTWPKSDLGAVHILHQYTSGILADDQPASQPTSHLIKCQHNPKLDTGGGTGQYFVDWPVSQPAAIGQPTSHLTKCQVDPKSDIQGVSIFYINTQLTFCQIASQPAAIGQPSCHQIKCQPGPNSHLRGPSAMPCHFTHYIFQAFPDKNIYKNINIKRDIGL